MSSRPSATSSAAFLSFICRRRSTTKAAFLFALADLAADVSVTGCLSTDVSGAAMVVPYGRVYVGQPVMSLLTPGVSTRLSGIGSPPMNLLQAMSCTGAPILIAYSG